MANKKNFLTSKQVSKYLGVSLRTIQHLSKHGRIKAFKIGSQWRYLRGEIEKYGLISKEGNFLTARQVSEYLYIPLRTIHRLSKQGKIEAFKIGRQWRYSKDDIEKYVSDSTDFSREPARKPDGQVERTDRSDRRSYPRINTNFICQYSISLPPFKNISCSGLIKNIGAGGVFISSQNGLMGEVEIDDPIDLSFVLTSCDIQARGKVVRKTDTGVGIKFKDIDEEVKSRIMEYAS